MQKIIDQNDGNVVKDCYPEILNKRETISKMAKRMGVHLIDMAECNITDMDSADYTDRLHPNTNGQAKMADFVFRKTVPILCDYI